MTETIHSNQFTYRVAAGLVPGWRSFRKFGYNEDIDTGTEDVWSNGGVKVWPSSAGVATVVSSSTADDADTGGGTPGTGALTVTFEGLDANYNEVSETFTMNGQSNVVGSVQFLRVHRGYVATVGTGGINAGNITCTVGGNIQSQIPDNVGQSQQTHYTVPAGHTLFIKEYMVAVGKETSGDQAVILGQIRLNGGANGESWRSISAIAGYQDIWSNDATVTAIPAKTDVRIQVQSDFTNVEVNGVYSGWLVRNDALDV